MCLCRLCGRSGAHRCLVSTRLPGALESPRVWWTAEGGIEDFQHCIVITRGQEERIPQTTSAAGTNKGLKSFSHCFLSFFPVFCMILLSLWISTNFLWFLIYPFAYSILWGFGELGKMCNVRISLVFELLLVGEIWWVVFLFFLVAQPEKNKRIIPNPVDRRMEVRISSIASTSIRDKKKGYPYRKRCGN